MSNWDQVAQIRRRQIESGLDVTFLNVFLPFYLTIIARLRPTNLLEVGSGTGHLLKEVSKRVISCIGVDPSREMCEVAKGVLTGTAVQVINTSIEEFRSESTHEMIVSHLCLQAISDIDGTVGTINSLLDARGAFVFAVPHPCFWNDYQKFIPASDYEYQRELGVEARLTISNDRETVMIVPYFHRPLAKYFEILARHGLWVDEFHEVFPPPDVMRLYKRPWDSPRYLAVVARKRCYDAGIES